MLQPLYCNLFGDHWPAHVPEPSAACFTIRMRFLVPPSQSLEQRLHLVHRCSTQFLEQAATWHAFVCEVSPHGFPSYRMGTFTSRTRCCTPPPHLAEHLLHPVQDLSLQSIGQGPRLHLRLATSGKHLAPGPFF